MKTKVSIYHLQVEAKLAIIALLKDQSTHAQVISDIETSLANGDVFKRDFMVEVQA